MSFQEYWHHTLAHLITIAMPCHIAIFEFHTLNLKKRNIKRHHCTIHKIFSGSRFLLINKCFMFMKYNFIQSAIYIEHIQNKVSLFLYDNLFLYLQLSEVNNDRLWHSFTTLKCQVYLKFVLSRFTDPSSFKPHWKRAIETQIVVCSTCDRVKPVCDILIQRLWSSNDINKATSFLKLP